METQISLPFEPKKLARSEHPYTSHEAALKSGELRSRHHRKILDALRLVSDSTPYQIAADSRLDVAAVFRRLNELEKAGLIQVAGESLTPTGRKCRTWRAT